MEALNSKKYMSLRIEYASRIFKLLPDELIFTRFVNYPPIKLKLCYLNMESVILLYALKSEIFIFYAFRCCNIVYIVC